MEAVNPATYDNGGILRPGWFRSVNRTGKPEPVLRPTTGGAS